MNKLNLFNKFYLDKEKDIIVNLYKTNEDEITYILETPNHNTGNLITNLAKICNVETIKNEKDMKIIKDKNELLEMGKNAFSISTADAEEKIYNEIKKLVK